MSRELFYELYSPNRTISHQPKLYDLDINAPNNTRINHPDFKWDEEWKKIEKKMVEKVNDQLKKPSMGCLLKFIKVMCDQLLASHFSDDIELIVPPLKVSALKCPSYKGMNDLVAHMIHFKMLWHQYACPNKI